MSELTGSYVTVDEAEAYIGNYYFDASALSAWSALSQSAKEQILRSSTRAIDTTFRFKGQKRVIGQPLEFPRWDRNKIGMLGVYATLYGQPAQSYDDSFVGADNRLENDGLQAAKHATIINAVYMAAYSHLEGKIISQSATSLKAESIGSTHVQYGSITENRESTAIKQGIFAVEKVRAELRDWISGSYMTL